MLHNLNKIAKASTDVIQLIEDVPTDFEIVPECDVSLRVPVKDRDPPLLLIFMFKQKKVDLITYCSKTHREPSEKNYHAKFQNKHKIVLMSSRNQEVFKEDYIYFTFRSITGCAFRVSV